MKNNIHKQIFDIKPRNFKLEPGNMIDIEVYYNPRDIGEHEIIVKSFFTNGKPFIIVLKGETIDKNMGCIQPMIKDLCMFPTPINLTYPVTNQIYFKNCGLLPITWSIDRDKIERFCNNNKISAECIDILENGGKLESNQTTFITILFKP